MIRGAEFNTDSYLKLNRFKCGVFTIPAWIDSWMTWRLDRGRRSSAKLILTLPRCLPNCQKGRVWRFSLPTTTSETLQDILLQNLSPSPSPSPIYTHLSTLVLRIEFRVIQTFLDIVRPVKALSQSPEKHSVLPYPISFRSFNSPYPLIPLGQRRLRCTYLILSTSQ